MNSANKEGFPKNDITLYQKQIFLAILFLMYFFCSFHAKYPSSQTPRDYID